MNNKIFLDKQILIDLYVNDKMFIKDMVPILGCCKQVITRHIKKFNLKRPNISNRKIKIDDNWIIEKYIHKNMSTIKIAEILKCSNDTIKKKLKSLNIKLRRNYIDISKRKFGKLKPIKRLRKMDKGGNSIWICKCIYGNLVDVSYKVLISGGRTSCKQCRYKKDYFLSGSLLASIKKNARKNKHQFSISREYLQDLWNKQHGICAISGIKLYLPKELKLQPTKICTASLDRIDSNKGYIEGNVQWVYKKINMMKQNYTMNEFIELCGIITNYQKSLKTNNY